MNSRRLSLSLSLSMCVYLHWTKMLHFFTREEQVEYEELLQQPHRPLCSWVKLHSNFYILVCQLFWTNRWVKNNGRYVHGSCYFKYILDAHRHRKIHGHITRKRFRLRLATWDDEVGHVYSTTIGSDHCLMLIESLPVLAATNRKSAASDGLHSTVKTRKMRSFPYFKKEKHKILRAKRIQLANIFTCSIPSIEKWMHL